MEISMGSGPIAKFRWGQVRLNNGEKTTFSIGPDPIEYKPGRYFEYHVLRPTLPILTPVADPDGPAGEASGIGDLQVLDFYFHTIQKGLVWGAGPFYNFPTSTSPQTGSGEWQIGPAFSLQDSRRKHWVTGFLL
ncbi:MAG: hypothetical protein OES09_10195, partial [Gammaproteobacteria bacterium]|nr:hypothetical protein [Gammaproteobacteria bacterium]